MRYEIKIPISENNLPFFYNWRDNLKSLKKAHDDRIVNSLYYDDFNLNFAHDNLIGISNRVKTRLRWYNNDNNFSYEFKFKKDKIGTKIIVPSNRPLDTLLLDSAFNYDNDEFKKIHNEKKIFAITSKFNLNPIIKVIYSRSYYEFMSKIRLTLDTPSFFQIVSHKFNQSKKKILCIF